MQSPGEDAARHVLREFGPPISAMRIAPFGDGGGMSGAVLWKLSSDEVSLPFAKARQPRTADEPSWCLRCWPAEHPSHQHLTWIHAQLVTAVANGCPFVAAPCRTESGSTIVQHQSRLWEVAPWLTGVADFHERPSRPRLRQAARALAQLHAAWCESSHVPPSSPPPAITRRWEGLAEFSSRSIPAWVHRVDSRHGEEIAQRMRQILPLLPAHWETAQQQLSQVTHLHLPIQPVLRDIWHDHLLFVGDELTGIVDYGAMKIDTPATDLARMLGSLVRGETALWRFALAEYAAIRPLQVDELAVLAPLDRCNIVLAAANWWRWLFVEGRKFSSLQSVQRRLAEIHRRLIAGRVSSDGFPQGFA